MPCKAEPSAGMSFSCHTNQLGCAELVIKLQWRHLDAGCREWRLNAARSIGRASRDRAVRGHRVRLRWSRRTRPRKNDREQAPVTPTIARLCLQRRLLRAPMRQRRPPRCKDATLQATALSRSGRFELARQPAVVPRHHTEQGIARGYGSQIRETVAEPEGQRPTKDDQDPNPRFPG